MSLSAQTFRRVMGNFATGVTVLTTLRQEGVFGMTANAVTSVSLEPTLVLVCIAHETVVHEYVERSKVYALNILSRDQQHLSDLFAGPDDAPERGLTTVAWKPAPSGCPILAGALAYLDCRVVDQLRGGDHSIFLGEVNDASVLDDQTEPLVYFRGRCRGVN